MKKLSLLLFAVVLFSCKTKAQYITIPDPNFKAYLQQKVPACFNGLGQMDTTCNDLSFIDTLNVSYMNISDLTGIQYTYPIYFDCSHNQISQFISPNYTSHINFSYNLLTSINVFNCSSLNCSHNLITNIGSFGTSNTHDINCSYNQLISLPPM